MAHPEGVAVVEGETARFHCDIEGMPKPVITWTKNSGRLPQSDRCAVNKCCIFCRIIINI